MSIYFNDSNKQLEPSLTRRSHELEPKSIFPGFTSYCNFTLDNSNAWCLELRVNYLEVNPFSLQVVLFSNLIWQLCYEHKSCIKTCVCSVLKLTKTSTLESKLNWEKLYCFYSPESAKLKNCEELVTSKSTRIKYLCLLVLELWLIFRTKVAMGNCFL